MLNNVKKFFGVSICRFDIQFKKIIYEKINSLHKYKDVILKFLLC